jgi:hypothetical protein
MDIPTKPGSFTLAEKPGYPIYFTGKNLGKI